PSTATTGAWPSWGYQQPPHRLSITRKQCGAARYLGAFFGSCARVFGPPKRRRTLPRGAGRRNLRAGKDVETSVHSRAVAVVVLGVSVAAASVAGARGVGPLARRAGSSFGASSRGRRSGRSGPMAPTNTGSCKVGRTRSDRRFRLIVRGLPSTARLRASRL